MNKGTVWLKSQITTPGFVIANFKFQMAILLALALPMAAYSEDSAPAQAKPNLANDQDAIRARYKRFNLTLQQMAEILRKQDPERADLLFRALGKSQETRIDDQMSLILSLLNKEQPQLGEAIERQEELLGQLKGVLELLQSEDRRSEIEKEKLRLQELVKDINKLLGKEKDVRAGTERGEDAKKLADKQAELEKQTEGLQKRVERQDAEKNGELPAQKTTAKPSDKSKGEKPEGDGKKPDGKNADEKKDEGRKPSEEKKPGDDPKPEDKDKKKEGEKGGEKSPLPTMLPLTPLVIEPPLGLSPTTLFDLVSTKPPPMSLLVLAVTSPRVFPAMIEPVRVSMLKAARPPPSPPLTPSLSARLRTSVD